MSDHVKVPVDWHGSLTREQAIKIIDNATDKDDPFWEYLVEEFYDEESDSMPSIYHVFHALGVTEEEYKAATGAENVSWPFSAKASPEPESAEPVAILCRQTDESKTEWFDHDPLIPGSTRHKIRANHGGWELLPVYASQPARGCEPITKYVELTREQAFEHLKTNSFHLERTGLYKLVINPDWKPQPPQE